MTREIAIYLPDLSGGGAERLHLQLAPCLAAAGWAPRLLLDRRAGTLLDQVPSSLPVDVLGAKRQLSALPRLIGYLRRRRPAVLVANMEHMNVMAILARRLAGAPTRIVVTQHNAFSEQVKRRSWQWRALPSVYRAVLPQADAIVAVSAGVADDLAARAHLDRRRIEVIHNGLVTPDYAERADAPAPHPWFGEARPVVVGMGRFVPQKDFTTLVEAVAQAGSAPRLILLGEGPERDALAARAAALGIADRVAMPGFVADPLPWLSRAGVFALSSRFEGFGNVLVEALACGTPVVTTDCPHGPAEIVEGGRYGALVPVGDPGALARAIDTSLASPSSPELCRARGREFTVERCAAAYDRLFRRLAGDLRP